MKFMLSWSTFAATRHDALRTFAGMTDADDEADHPDVTLIGRWHDLVAGQGVLICESDGLAAVQAWVLNWNGVIDVEVRPVLDDQECKATLRRKFGMD